MEEKPRYVLRKKGRYYWNPTAKMQAAGFVPSSLGKDRAKAYRQAEGLNRAWDTWQDQQRGRRKRKDLSALIEDFKADPVAYGALALKTQYEADKAFSRIEPTLGKVLVNDIDRQLARALYNKWCGEASVSIANKVHKWLVWLLTYALENGQLPYHPLLRMKKLAQPKRKARWAQAEVEAVYSKAMTDAKATSGNHIPKRPSVAHAMQLAYDSSQRMGDILALRWNQFDGEGIKVEQSKTGETVWCPLSAKSLEMVREMKEANRARKRPSTHMIVSEATGQPYSSVEVFSCLFRKFRIRAGITRDVNFRDLRRTAASDLGDAGATEAEISAMTGHAIGSSVLKDYVIPSKAAGRNARRKRYGDDGT